MTDTLSRRLAALERSSAPVVGAVIVAPGETTGEALKRCGSPPRAVIIPAKCDALPDAAARSPSIVEGDDGSKGRPED